MQVQDLIITVVVCAFVVSALPMIFDTYTPPYRTSVLMVVGSAALAGTYATMGLWLSVTVEALAAVLWTVLVVQRARAGR